jgi:hypothetical protein
MGGIIASSTKESNMSKQIFEVTEVPENERMGFLPKHLGNFFPAVRFERFEHLVYTLMEKHTSGQYLGGHWDFCEVSNGAFYMKLDTTEVFNATNPDNWFEGQMSAEALSLAVNILAQNQILWALHNKGHDVSDLIVKYEALRDYAYSHAEHVNIIKFID